MIGWKCKHEDTHTNYISALNLIEYYSSNNLKTDFYRKLKSYFNLEQEIQTQEQKQTEKQIQEQTQELRDNHMLIGLWGNINNSN